MVCLGLLVGIFTGNGEEMSKTIIGSVDSTVTFIISLVGLMCFWCGVMKVAEKSGLTEKLAKLMKPILKLIFKEAGKDEKAENGMYNTQKEEGRRVSREGQRTHETKPGPKRETDGEGTQSHIAGLG
jgi:hypothetical protein